MAGLLLLGLVAFAMMVMLAVVDFRRGVPTGAAGLRGCPRVARMPAPGSSRVIAFSGGALLLAGYVALLIAS